MYASQYCFFKHPFHLHQTFRVLMLAIVLMGPGPVQFARTSSAVNGSIHSYNQQLERPNALDGLYGPIQVPCNSVSVPVASLLYEAGSISKDRAPSHSLALSNRVRFLVGSSSES